MNAFQTPELNPLTSHPEMPSVYPMSEGQKGLWFIHQIAPESVAYNEYNAVKINCPLDREKWKATWKEILRRHAILRTNYGTNNEGEPVQIVRPTMDVPMEVIDASSWSDERLKKEILARADVVYNLETGSILRLYLFQRSATEYVQLFTLHHIANDGTTKDLFLKEFQQLYAGIALEEPLAYTDFVNWEAEMLKSPQGEKLWQYWEKQLAGELPILDLPTDKPRPRVVTYRGDSYQFKLDEELVSRLKQLKFGSISLFQIALTAFYVLLYRYTNQEDILVNIPTENRRGQKAFKNVAGYFISIAVLRANLEGNPTFKDLLMQVAETAFGAMKNEAYNYPFSELVKRLKVKRDLSRHPFSPVMFNWRKLGWYEPESRDGLLPIEPYLLEEQRGAPYDMTVEVIEVGNELSVRWNYNTDLFNAETIERMVGHYLNLLEGIVDNPEMPVAQLPLLTKPASRNTVLEKVFVSTKKGETTNIIGISGLHHSVSFKKKIFPHLSAREYRIAQGFDSAAALINREGIIAVAAEERFTRDKATGAFPIHGINYCLAAANLKLDNIDYIAHGFCYDPLKSFYEESDYTKQQFQEVYAREAQIQTLSQFLPGHDWNKKLVSVPHHLAHAASTFYVSGFPSALILITDGMGELCCSTIAVGKGNQIKIIKQITTLNSLGILYGVFTLYLGFFMALDEYKVMGLAPYGNSRRYFSQIMDLIKLKDDGSYTIPILFKNTTNEEKETYRGTLNKLIEMFGPPREPKTEMTQRDMDIAAGLQAALQATLMHVLRHFKKETGETNLCMAGGVGLNCTANGVIKRSRMFKNMFIQPAAGDDGSALGAALYIQHFHEANIPSQKMGLPLWGPSYTNEEIARVLQERTECESTFFDDFEELAKEVANLIAEGNIVAWFQGRMEYGPRALGCRSILADPRDPKMRDRINMLIKKREGFRPFAPAVIEEMVSQFFEVNKGDTQLYEYMLCVTQVRKNYREKLPAITHVDGSARVQTVSKEQNPRFWTVINELGSITGIPVVVNTSFNVKGQPIVCTPAEAVDTFLFANLDLLVMGNYLVIPKKEQQVTERQEEKAKELEAAIASN